MATTTPKQTTVEQMVEYLQGQARGYLNLARQLEQLKKRREDSVPVTGPTAPVPAPAKGKKSVGRPKGYSPKTVVTPTKPAQATVLGGLSQESRQKIADAQKARWARVHAERDQAEENLSERIQEALKDATPSEPIGSFPEPLPNF